MQTNKLLFNKKYYVTLVFFVLVVIASIVLLVFRSEREFAQFNTLNKSNYSYVIQTDGPTSENMYALYNTNFTTNNNTINAYSLMEFDDVTYNDNNYINKSHVVKGSYGKLENNSIAISKNIAIQYNLSIDSIVKSKNSVSNSIEEYKVQYIFTTSFGLLTTDIDTNKGVIIYSFNEQLKENLNGSFISFANKTPQQLTKEYSVNLIDFISKSTLQEKIMISLVLNQSLVFIMILVSSIVITIFISEHTTRYFRFLKLNGDNVKKIKYSIFKYNVLSIGIYILVLIVLLQIINFVFLKSILVTSFTICIAGIISLFVANYYSYKRIGR